MRPPNPPATRPTASALLALRKDACWTNWEAMRSWCARPRIAPACSSCSSPEAQDLQAAVNTEHLDEVNEVFLSLTCSRYRTDPLKATAIRQRAAGSLASILEATLTAWKIGSRLTCALLNRLGAGQYPDDTSAILEQSRALLTDEFLQAYDAQVAELEQEAQQGLAEHLKQVPAKSWPRRRSCAPRSHTTPRQAPARVPRLGTRGGSVMGVLSAIGMCAPPYRRKAPNTRFPNGGPAASGGCRARSTSSRPSPCRARISFGGRPRRQRVGQARLELLPRGRHTLRRSASIIVSPYAAPQPAPRMMQWDPAPRPAAGCTRPNSSR